MSDAALEIEDLNVRAGADTRLWCKVRLTQKARDLERDLDVAMEMIKATEKMAQEERDLLHLYSKPFLAANFAHRVCAGWTVENGASFEALILAAFADSEAFEHLRSVSMQHPSILIRLGGLQQINPMEGYSEQLLRKQQERATIAIDDDDDGDENAAPASSSTRPRVKTGGIVGRYARRL
ncbi:hypothetical protein SDRG_13602 [Saprolegnia diclina VS20]|uniref:Uncharacterized protein n=1 Tax=Saprolegnia diclina (strain VS20) TaxID=1156394 RepID=T0R9A6_SAPDV|nr:hypothetical protein SDRG_13602 [Saprolegnia diclina VS20]EQC28728.1 hypothetical protein SDRG_13602 [Saprolegnia diclina VS20]|eukprot:XP_008617920.1 hypothetical protein SDRG_13602 [Saprolegnia diclina VS20]